MPLSAVEVDFPIVSQLPLIVSFDELMPSDIMISRNVDVLLFEKLIGAQKKQFLTCQTRILPSWKVLRNTIQWTMLRILVTTPLGIRE